MRNNDFTFNKDILLQIFGTAMGKPYAPSQANVYLIDLDEKARNQFRIKPKFYLCFLDDILFVRTGSRAELENRKAYLNTLIPNIKITLDISDLEVNFLDTTVFKQECESLFTLGYFPLVGWAMEPTCSEISQFC